MHGTQQSSIRPGRRHRRGLACSALLLAALALSACAGEDSTSYSETLSLRLSGIQDQDVNNGTYQAQKNVNTEQGNPYAAFLRNARQRLGHDPASIAIRSAAFRLETADSTGATAFDQVFGSMELFISDGESSVGMGTASGPSGTTVQVPVPADQSSLAPVESEMIAGSFDVGLRGSTVASPPADFDVHVTIDIQFEAIP